MAPSPPKLTARQRAILLELAAGGRILLDRDGNAMLYTATPSPIPLVVADLQPLDLAGYLESAHPRQYQISPAGAARAAQEQSK